MTSYLLRRAAVAVLLVILASSAALLLTGLAPGDFASTQMDLDRATRDRLRAAAGLDQPLAVQYGHWLRGAIHLDLGRSLLYSRPVTEMVGERLVNTAILGAAALLVATALGIPLGLVAGASGGAAARCIRLVSLLVVSVPPLVASLVLVLVAGRTGWWPLGGMSSAAAADLAWPARLADLARHLPLPTLALALPLAAVLERAQAQAVADAIGQGFVRASLARGLSPARAVLAHAWPSSLGPVLGLYGAIVGSLFSGSFVVEIVTAWPGLGRLLFDALQGRDLYLVAGCAAAGAVVLAVGTFAADAAHAWVDPRVRDGSRG